jgi:recombination protein RecA
VRVVKNKVAPPFKVAEFDILYNEGISKAGDVLDLAVGLGVVEKRGSFYTYRPEGPSGTERRVGQGREQARQALKGDPALMQELEDTVRASFKPATEPAEEAG